MDIQHLAYFCTLCEELNYTTAAQRCYISRQAMRQVVLGLENTYGLPLIDNERNRLRLTPGGKLLWAQAKSVLSAYHELEHVMRACHTAKTPLRVGMSRSLLPFYCPEIAAALDRFPADYPEQRLHAQMMDADDVLGALMDGSLDAGIVVDSGYLPLPLRRHVLRSNPLCITLSSRHPLADKTQLTLSDLNGVTLQLMSDPFVCFHTLSSALAASAPDVRYKVVPEYYDVGCNIRDNHCVAVDQNGPLPLQTLSIARERMLPLENGRFTLHVVLLTPQDAAPGALLLAQYLTQIHANA